MSSTEAYEEREITTTASFKADPGHTAKLSGQNQGQTLEVHNSAVFSNMQDNMKEKERKKLFCSTKQDL